MAEMNSNKAQLGCGTLILIALIVFFFSGRTGVDDLKRNIEDLNTQVIVLQQKVDALTRAIEKQQGSQNRIMTLPAEKPLPTKAQ
jgi:outer membrane murein-binding lipoprotein Lpp